MTLKRFLLASLQIHSKFETTVNRNSYFILEYCSLSNDKFYRYISQFNDCLFNWIDVKIFKLFKISRVKENHKWFELIMYIVSLVRCHEIL